MSIFGRSSCLRKRASRARRTTDAARVLLGTLSLAGCSSALPVVPMGAHPPTLAPRQLTVGSEAPPVQISEISPQPRKECRWLDGHWENQNQAWRWVEGHWILSPRGCFYAPASTVWTPLSADRTELFYTPPAWYQKDGSARCQSAPLPCTR